MGTSKGTLKTEGQNATAKYQHLQQMYLLMLHQTEQDHYCRYIHGSLA